MWGYKRTLKMIREGKAKLLILTNPWTVDETWNRGLCQADQDRDTSPQGDGIELGTACGGTPEYAHTASH